MSQLSPRIALNAALAAANSAAESLIADYQRNRDDPTSALKAWMKSPGALVTEADLAADRAIAEALGRSGIDAALVSEESRSGDGDEDASWLVDPLCGTVPFRAGMPHWGINIAFRQSEELVAGVVALPANERTLAVAHGEPATLNGEPFAPRDPELPMDEAVVGLEVDGGLEWTRLLTQGTGETPALSWPGSVSHINTFASAAYPMSLVCTGAMSGVVFYTIDSVHLAAGAVIAEALGVVVSDENGNPLDWTSEEPYAIAVIAWPSIHRQLIEAIGG